MLEVGAKSLQKENLLLMLVGPRICWSNLPFSRLLDVISIKGVKTNTKLSELENVP